MQMLRISLSPEGWLANGINTTIEPPASNESMRLDWWMTGINFTETSHKCPPVESRISYSAIDSLQFVAPGQKESTLNPSDTFNVSSFQRTYWSSFAYNESIKPDAGVIPYNSTLWLNQVAFRLSAPFLDVGYQCSGQSIFTSLGNCVCYEGQPIPIERLGDDKMLCNTAPGYVWGFSSNLLVKGTAMEAAWLACTFLCYVGLKCGSRMIRVDKQGDKTEGLMRLALDFSESARDDLGSEQSRVLKEKELKKGLEGFRIGYQRDSEEVERSSRCRYRIASGIQRQRERKRYKPTEIEVYEDLNWRIYIYNQTTTDIHRDA